MIAGEDDHGVLALSHGFEPGEQPSDFVIDQLGAILKALDETGQRDKTVVIFTTDHGEALGDHGLLLKGCRFYEGLVRVPLIWSWPAKFRAGLRSDALVELIDIAPTLLDSAGLPIPERMQGRSLLPILSGDAACRQAVFETARHFASGLVGLLHIFDPEAVYLFGAYVTAGDCMIEAISREVTQLHSLKLPGVSPRLEKSALNLDTAALGAAFHMMSEHVRMPLIRPPKSSASYGMPLPMPRTPVAS